MRIVVQVVVEMTDKQVIEYAADVLGVTTGPLPRREIRQSVKHLVVEFASGGSDNVGSGFQVSLKGDDQ